MCVRYVFHGLAVVCHTVPLFSIYINPSKVSQYPLILLSCDDKYIVMKTDLSTMYTIKSELESKDIVADVCEFRGDVDNSQAIKNREYIAVDIDAIMDIYVVRELVGGLPIRVYSNSDCRGDLQLFFN